MSSYVSLNASQMHWAPPDTGHTTVHDPWYGSCSDSEWPHSPHSRYLGSGVSK